MFRRSNPKTISSSKNGSFLSRLRWWMKTLDLCLWQRVWSVKIRGDSSQSHFIALVLLLSLFYTIIKNIKITFRVFVALKIIPDLHLTTLWGVLSVRKTGGHRRRAVTPDCHPLLPSVGPEGCQQSQKLFLNSSILDSSLAWVRKTQLLLR